MLHAERSSNSPITQNPNKKGRPDRQNREARRKHERFISFSTLSKRLLSGVAMGGAQCLHRRLGDAVSFDPAAGLDINPRHSSYGSEAKPAFSVNVLKKNQMELAAHFVGRPRRQIGLMEWPTAAWDAIAARALLVRMPMVSEHPAGDHVSCLEK